MINEQSILSLYKDKPTLYEWLKKVEEALKSSVLVGISVISIDATHKKLRANFADGTYIETPTFELAQGPQGPQGPRGLTGETGPAGPQGPTGAQGPQGLKGDTGATGPKGDTGATGPKGDKGEKGDTGLQGPQGVAGPQGPQGIAGLQGPQGQQGLQGPKGEDGNSFQIVGQVDSISELPESAVLGTAYFVGTTAPRLVYAYVDFEGTPQWKNQGQLQGPKGDTGETGPQGVAGPQGPTGAQGATGPQGPQGQQGIQGPKGNTGATGPKGDKGEKGDTGETGPQGPQGIQGPQGVAGVANMSSWDLTYGSSSVSYDTTDGITLNTITRITNSDSTTKDVNMELELPIKAISQELVIDKAESEEFIEIGLAQEVSNKLASALTTPQSAPAEHKLVGIDTSNGEELVGYGASIGLANGKIQLQASNSIPSSANASGLQIIDCGTTDPATKYSGYLYIITES